MVSQINDSGSAGCSSRYDLPEKQAIPKTLRQYKRFVTWKQDGEQKTPVTLTGRDVHPIDVTSRSDLLPCQEAMSIAVQCDLGLGFSFIPPDPLIGFDIDFDPFEEESNTAEKVKRLMDRFCPFREDSPSGEGLHFYFRVDDDIGIENRIVEISGGGSVQCRRGGYLTLTGDRVCPCPEGLQLLQEQQIRDIQEMLQGIDPSTDALLRCCPYTNENEKADPVNAVHETQSDYETRYQNPDDFSVDPNRILEEAKSDCRLHRLWDGEYLLDHETQPGLEADYETQSEADAAIVQKLHKYTRQHLDDPREIRAMVKHLIDQSPFYDQLDQEHKDKWNRPRYYDLTFDNMAEKNS